MGTKNNPGRFDCHDKAESDEPMFTLLGRDPLASMLVLLWADVRERMGGTESEVLQEARECALHMFEHCSSLGKGEKQVAALAALQAAMSLTEADVSVALILNDKTTSMIKGLVRFAELREQDEPGGKVWDDKSCEALELARECGWGSDRTGRLP